MLRYKTETRLGLVALYDIRPGNGAGQFLQPWSLHGAWQLSNNRCLHNSAPRYLCDYCIPVANVAARSQLYDPPAAIKLSFPATTWARSAVGPSLSLAQRSGTHCQTSSATHRYRLTVSVASLKHSCLQTRISVHSTLEVFFCGCAI